jgi:hypothetical protein
MTVLMQTDFPDPVAPAIRQCGILLKSPRDIHFARILMVRQMQFLETDLLRIKGGDFDADGGLAWNRGDDADRFCLEIEGDVIFQSFYLLHFYADCGMDLEGSDGRAAIDLAHFSFDPKAQQCLFEDLRLPLQIFFQRGLIDFFRVIEQRRRRKLVCGEISVHDLLGIDRRLPFIEGGRFRFRRRFFFRFELVVHGADFYVVVFFFTGLIDRLRQPFGKGLFDLIGCFCLKGRSFRGDGF